MCFLLLLRWGWSSRCFNSGAYKNNLVPQTYALSEVKYCIAGKFSEDFNLTVWKIVKKIAKFKFSAIIKHAIMHTTHMHMQLGLYTHVKHVTVQVFKERICTSHSSYVWRFLCLQGSRQTCNQASEAHSCIERQMEKKRCHPPRDKYNSYTLE